VKCARGISDIYYLSMMDRGCGKSCLREHLQTPEHLRYRGHTRTASQKPLELKGVSSVEVIPVRKKNLYVESEHPSTTIEMTVVIHFFDLLYTPDEDILARLDSIYGASLLYLKTVQRWTTKLRNRKTDLDNAPRPGRRRQNKNCRE
jgi:hypothetical protein